MKKREIFKLKKAVAAILAAGLCLLTVSGCSSAESQEEVVVVKKPNEELMSEQMMTEDEGESDNVAEQVQAPESNQELQDNITPEQEQLKKEEEAKVEEIRKLVEENNNEIGKLPIAVWDTVMGTFMFLTHR